MNISSEKKLSIRAALGSALSIISKNKLSLLNLYLAYFLLAALGAILSLGLFAMLSFLWAPLSIIGLSFVFVTFLVLGQSFLFGWNKIALALLDGKAVSSNMFLFSPRELWHQFSAIFLNFLMLLLGTICLILPGLYLWVRFEFFDFVLVDDADVGAIESLKISSAMKAGRSWQVFRFLILSALLFALLSSLVTLLTRINKVFYLISSILALLVILMRAYAYRQLQPKQDTEDLLETSPVEHGEF